jgi:hypothetical protein
MTLKINTQHALEMQNSQVQVELDCQSRPGGATRSHWQSMMPVCPGPRACKRRRRNKGFIRIQRYYRGTQDALAGGRATVRMDERGWEGGGFRVEPARKKS